jgi:Mg2+/Co2+ transporter CorB
MLNNPTILILVLICFFLFSSYLSASETAITAASKAKLHQLSKDGSEKAKMIRKMQKDTSLVLAGILLGNITLNSLSTALSTTMCNRMFGEDIGAVVAPLVMSFFIVVFVEVLPKLVAVRNPEKFLLKTIPFLKRFNSILTPLTLLIQWIAHFTLRLFGVKDDIDLHAEHTSIEELKGVIDLHHGPGQDVQHERAMLKSILDLGTVEVSEIMTHRKNVTMINADDPLEQIIDQLLKSPFSRIPLWKNDPDNIIGVLNAKAFFRAHHQTPDSFDVLSVANKPWFIPESTDLLEQLQAFRQRHEHFSLVVDEYGSFMGVVTLEDILEEIVGEIFDEHDVSVRGVRPQADGSFIIDGGVTIRDLNRQFDWGLPDGRAATLAGFLLFQVRSIPEVGQIFMFDGFRFEILRRQRNQITLVRVTPTLKIAD